MACGTVEIKMDLFDRDLDESFLLDVYLISIFLDSLLAHDSVHLMEDLVFFFRIIWCLAFRGKAQRVVQMKRFLVLEIPRSWVRFLP